MHAIKTHATLRQRTDVARSTAMSVMPIQPIAAVNDATGACVMPEER